MPFSIVITNAGRAALVNAANTGTGAVEITEIGLSQAALVPAETLVALPGEIKRTSAIAGQLVADDVIHVTLKDESSDAYTLRSLALYLGDGTLFAIAGQADPILIKSPSAISLIAFDIAFADVSAALITFGNTDFALPSATTDRQGVVELATLAEAEAGIDAVRALTPQTAKQAVAQWVPSATTTRQGIVELATNAEAQTGTDTSRALTPAAARSAVMAWVKDQDGSGSGLDADTLDGKHADELLPAGLIVMWSGAVAAIPTGWALCNGANGTPDLRDRFVIGAGGSLAPRSAGGAATHSHAINVAGSALTAEQLPPHNHAMFANVAVDTALTGQTAVARATTSSPGESEYQMRSAGSAQITLGITGNTGSGQEHSHGATSEAASSIPPYLALAYIMKL